ncbi:hypothetical protein SDC9_163478 [bioreactor metagenome]|uniref:Uncharacterized protein n=1 Tax=bioreactor metagenome TaxID=1076179 RepID=A0A645FQ84_9ZZZZ
MIVIKKNYVDVKIKVGDKNTMNLNVVMKKKDLITHLKKNLAAAVNLACLEY